MSFGRLLLLLLTGLAFAMVALAFSLGPPPLWVPVLFSLSYLGVILWGVMNMRLGMFGDAICAVRGADGCVALTFDDGPDPVSTPLALRALRRQKAHATFFVVGKKAERYPQLLKAIVAGGHVLGVHSYEHQRLYSLLPPKRVKEDIERTREIIFSSTGRRPIWFRPPIGLTSPRTAAGVERAGATVIGWGVQALDGLRKTTDEQCVKRVVAGLTSGAIVLLHDGWEREEVDPEAGLSGCPAGVRSLEEILSACRANGLRAVTIEEMLQSSLKARDSEAYWDLR